MRFLTRIPFNSFIALSEGFGVSGCKQTQHMHVKKHVKWTMTDFVLEDGHRTRVCCTGMQLYYVPLLSPLMGTSLTFNLFSYTDEGKSLSS